MWTIEWESLLVICEKLRKTTRISKKLFERSEDLYDGGNYLRNCINYPRPDTLVAFVVCLDFVERWLKLLLQPVNACIGDDRFTQILT